MWERTKNTFAPPAQKLHSLMPYNLNSSENGISSPQQVRPNLLRPGQRRRGNHREWPRQYGDTRKGSETWQRHKERKVEIRWLQWDNFSCHPAWANKDLSISRRYLYLYKFECRKYHRRFISFSVFSCVGVSLFLLKRGCMCIEKAFSQGILGRVGAEVGCR